MAPRLKHRYPKYAEYWRMDAESCLNSSPSVSLSDERLAELKAVSEIGLSEGGRGNESA